MPEITGQLDVIAQGGANCPKAGFHTLYWAEYGDIDWATMFGDPLQFDTTNRLILDYTMLNSAVFKKVQFKRNAAYYEVTQTDEQDEANLLISLLWEGKDNARKNSFDNAFRVCNKVAHVFDYNGKERVFGVDFNGLEFLELNTPLHISRILDHSGQRGSSKARDEMDLGGAGDFLPLYATVGEANMPV